MTRLLNHPSLAALATVIALAAAPLPATSAPIFQSRAACLAKAEEAPDFARADARAWERQGGGADARLCQAMAALIGGDWAAAAPALEASAKEMSGEGAAVQANLMTRAALAWREAGQLDKAEAAHARAISLAPDDAQILIDRAVTRSVREAWWDVIADLDAALERSPGSAEALLLRADAQARLGRRFEAMQDLDTLLAEQADSVDALLLRGELRADGEDFQGARADWLDVLRLAPDSGAARQARRNLEALDAFAKARAGQ